MTFLLAPGIKGLNRLSLLFKIFSRFSRQVFSQESSIADVRLGSKYVYGSSLLLYLLSTLRMCLFWGISTLRFISLYLTLHKYFPWPFKIFTYSITIRELKYYSGSLIEKHKKFDWGLQLFSPSVMLQKWLIFDIIIFLKHFILNLDI